MVKRNIVVLWVKTSVAGKLMAQAVQNQIRYQYVLTEVCFASAENMLMRKVSYRYLYT